VPHILKVVSCQTPGCVSVVVLQHSILLRTKLHPDRSATGDPYIDVACPECAHVFRYTPDMIRLQVYDTPDPYQLPAQTVWLGVWLKCDGNNCASHVLVESAMGASAKAKDVVAFVARWQVDDEVMCYSEHQAKHPPLRMWDSISDAEWGLVLP
jgi:hypothetical protein